MAKKILIVEDEADIVELISYNLEIEGYDVVSVGTGEEAVKSVVKEKPDLILLDVMLPGLSGFDICKHLKADVDHRAIPIMMVTARSEDGDIVKGLDTGADDYLVKPFSPKVLKARVRALLRRDYNQLDAVPDKDIVYGDIFISPGKRDVTVKGTPVKLTYSEFQALLLLLSNPGWVFSRYQLISKIHGEDHIVTDRTIDVMMVSLRKKLGPCAKYLETVRGVGYRLVELD